MLKLVCLLIFFNINMTLSAARLLLGDGTQIHYKVFSSQNGETIADLLYFHGFGDHLENHKKLFLEFNQAGIRVISFDLPSHGKTRGRDLNRFAFQELANISATIENETLEEANRPLVIAGYSLGGLLGVRILQDWQKIYSRPVHSAIFYAPAVSPKVCVGNTFCKVTNETLSHNSALYYREIYPDFPMAKPIFALNFLREARKSFARELPNIPITIFVAGVHQDRYVKSQQTIEWIQKNNSLGASIQGVHCRNAKHELDNEPREFGGDYVRLLSAQVTTGLIKQQFILPHNPYCTLFL